MTRLIALGFALTVASLAHYANRTATAAGQDDHYCSRSMRGGYAYGEWYVRENARSPCRQQVRPRSDLLEFEASPRRRHERAQTRAQ